MRIAIAVSLYACALTAQAQEVIALETRPGVTQVILVERAPDHPLAIALLFPGSAGNIRLRMEDGAIRFSSSNFLVRSRQEFVQRGVLAVVIDAPSDKQASGMDDTFRLGGQHAADIAGVITELKKRHPELPVFLVGTSRGTVSAASLGQRMPDAVNGVVLSATLLQAGRRPGQAGLAGFDFSAIRAPLLFVHHRQDGCSYTPYRAAERLAGRYPLVSVSGGPPAQSAPCEALSEHGFLGREPETVEAIVNWMLKKPFRKEIE